MRLFVDKVMAEAVHAQVGSSQFGGRGVLAVQVAGEEPKS